MSFTDVGNKVLALKKFALNVVVEGNEYSKTFRAFGYMIGQFLKVTF